MITRVFALTPRPVPGLENLVRCRYETEDGVRTRRPITGEVLDSRFLRGATGSGRLVELVGPVDGPWELFTATLPGGSRAFAAEVLEGIMGSGIGAATLCLAAAASAEVRSAAGRAVTNLRVTDKTIWPEGDETLHPSVFVPAVLAALRGETVPPAPEGAPYWVQDESGLGCAPVARGPHGALYCCGRDPGPERALVVNWVVRASGGAWSRAHGDRRSDLDAIGAPEAVRPTAPVVHETAAGSW